LVVQAPNRQIKLNFMLADAAQIQQGKLYVLGAAATMRTPESTLMAICGTVSIPWDFSNRQHVVTATLLAGDQPFMVDTPLGLQEWRLEARLEAGRPPGFPRGGNLVVPFAAQFQIPNLRVGVYEFRFSVNGQVDIDSAITMVVVPGAAPVGPPA
jgi:hypothetical protein